MKMKVGASLVDDDAAPLLILVYDVLVYIVVVADVPSFQNNVLFVNLMRLRNPSRECHFKGKSFQRN